MRSGILRCRVASLRLRIDAPWPREIDDAHRAALAARVQSGLMNTAATPLAVRPVFAPSTGQILPFPVAACRNLFK